MTASNAMMLSFFFALPFISHADLRAGIRRSAAQAAGTAQVVDSTGSLAYSPLPQDAPSNAIVVNLTRVNARNLPDAQGNYYVGHISIGSPAQKLTVLFHTSSGHVMLPHRACQQLACTEHKRYSPWQSITAMDVNLNGEAVTKGHRFAKGDVKRQAVILDYTDSELGAGEAKSLIVRDHVCVEGYDGDKGCVDLEVLAATILPDTPFRGMPNDGIVGLGLESLSAGPLCSFFGRFVEGSKNMLPQFGISYGQDGGQIHFGGHNENHFVPPLRWLPVQRPEEGFWQVAITGVRVGGTVIDDCADGCFAVMDTGASRIGVQNSKFSKIREALVSHTTKVVDGGCQGPELIFDLGEFTMSLATEDYTDAKCEPELGPVNMAEKKFNGVYIFAAPLLRRYYAAFDWDSSRIGFARTALPSTKAVVV